MVESFEVVFSGEMARRGEAWRSVPGVASPVRSWLKVALSCSTVSAIPASIFSRSMGTCRGAGDVRRSREVEVNRAPSHSFPSASSFVPRVCITRLRHTGERGEQRRLRSAYICRVKGKDGRLSAFATGALCLSLSSCGEKVSVLSVMVDGGRQRRKKTRKKNEEEEEQRENDFR